MYNSNFYKRSLELVSCVEMEWKTSRSISLSYDLKVLKVNVCEYIRDKMMYLNNVCYGEAQTRNEHAVSASSALLVTRISSDLWKSDTLQLLTHLFLSQFFVFFFLGVKITILLIIPFWLKIIYITWRSFIF